MGVCTDIDIGNDPSARQYMTFYSPKSDISAGIVTCEVAMGTWTTANYDTDPATPPQAGDKCDNSTTHSICVPDSSELNCISGHYAVTTLFPCIESGLKCEEQQINGLTQAVCI